MRSHFRFRDVSASVIMMVPLSRSTTMCCRFAACAGLFVVSALLVGQRVESLGAQNPKDKKDNALEKQLKAAQQDLAQAEKQIVALRQDVNQLKAINNRLENVNNQLQASLKKEKNDGDDKTIKALQATLDGYRRGGAGSRRHVEGEGGHGGERCAEPDR